MATSKYQLTVDNRHQLTIAQALWHSQPMVDKNELRAAFSSRLHEALNDAGVRSRGRGVDIQKQLKSVGVNKTTQAISKWLNGEAMAEADSMVALSAWLNVRREWLEYGVAPKAAAHSLNKQPLGVSDQASFDSLTANCRVIPLISWEEAVTWSGETREHHHHEFERWLSCPIPISPSGYALEVKGESMTNLGGGRSYPAGCIIFVDPEIIAAPGDGVIAKIPKANKATFKILAEDLEKRFLRPINPQYPIIDIAEGITLCGKVIGSFIRE